MQKAVNLGANVRGDCLLPPNYSTTPQVIKNKFKKICQAKIRQLDPLYTRTCLA